MQARVRGTYKSVSGMQQLALLSLLLLSVQFVIQSGIRYLVKLNSDYVSFVHFDNLDTAWKIRGLGNTKYAITGKSTQIKIRAVPILSTCDRHAMVCFFLFSVCYLLKIAVAAVCGNPRKCKSN